MLISHFRCIPHDMIAWHGKRLKSKEWVVEEVVEPRDNDQTGMQLLRDKLIAYLL